MPEEFACPECDGEMQCDPDMYTKNYAYFWCPDCMVALELYKEPGDDRLYGNQVFI